MKDLRETIDAMVSTDYEDPENERAFREWEKEYDARKRGA